MYFLYSVTLPSNKPGALLVKAYDSNSAQKVAEAYDNSLKFPCSNYEPVCYAGTIKELMDLFNVANSEDYWNRKLLAEHIPVIDVTKWVYRGGEEII